LWKHVSTKLLDVSLSCLHFSLVFSEGEVKSPCFLQVWWALLQRVNRKKNALKQTRIAHQRLTFLPVSKAHTNKFYIFQQCTYTIFVLYICIIVFTRRLKLWGEIIFQSCYHCHGEIQEGDLVVYAPKFGKDVCWHPACFMCSTCEELLVDLVYGCHAKHLLCERHYAEKIRPRCPSCDEVIIQIQYILVITPHSRTSYNFGDKVRILIYWGRNLHINYMIFWKLGLKFVDDKWVQLINEGWYIKGKLYLVSLLSIFSILFIRLP
jgi:hypothetical protein